jgi:hypothetical protein
MRTAKAFVNEIYLDRRRAARFACHPTLIPAPGQYVLAQAQSEPDAPLAVPVFSAGPCPGGFYAAPPLPADWQPGTRLSIRGPLGKGFQLPASSRFIALAAFTQNPARLLALTQQALAQNAAIILLTNDPPDGLSAAIEISPLSALPETLHWADYLALDLPRDALPAALKLIVTVSYSGIGQALIETHLPCGGMGECGICAVSTSTGSVHSLPKGYKLACKDGPVFDLKTLLP